MSSLNKDFQSFYEYRIKSNMNTIQREYLLGKRIFDKYDIEDDWHFFNGLVFDDIQFTHCIIEACFSKCSFKNAHFLNCNLKTVSFIDCNLTNSTIDECLIESIDLTNSLLGEIEFGTNYAYGATVSKNLNLS